MVDTSIFDGKCIPCPFCGQSITDIGKIFQPDIFICPVCKSRDTDWNVMITCGNCGLSPRLFECPHCKRDLDTSRFMGSFSPDYKDYIGIEKYHGPRVKHCLSEMDILFALNESIDQDKKDGLIGMISGISFLFPANEKCIDTFKIYDLQVDKSIETKFWINGWLYAREKYDSDFDIGQLAISLSPSMSIMFYKLLDVSRNYLDFFNVEWELSMLMRDELKKLIGKKCWYDGANFELTIRKKSDAELIDVEEDCIVIKNTMIGHVDKIPFYAIQSIDRRDWF